MTTDQKVAGLNPAGVTSIDVNVSGPGRYQSGQMGQTVNLLAYAFGGSNPSPPTQNTAEIAQLVEHDLAKVGVASSSLVFRSKIFNIMVR